MTAIDDISTALQGTTQETVVGGVATYTDLAETKATTINLTFYNGATTVGPSNNITVNPGPASQVAFSTEATVADRRHARTGHG